MTEEVEIEINGQIVTFEVGRTYDFVWRRFQREHTTRGKFLRLRDRTTLELETGAVGQVVGLGIREIVNIVVG
jgi:hypothetical protein